MQEACVKRIDELFEKYRDEIEAMPLAQREKYSRIARQGTDPRPVHPAPPSIYVRKETPPWEKHLYADAAGKFGWKAGGWEEPVLKEEMKAKNFAGWLRNVPKKPWACACRTGEANPSRCSPTCSCSAEGNKIKIHVLDPHDDSRGDAPEKAAGMAEFARKHGAAFGRIEVIRVVQGRIERLQLHRQSVQDAVAKVTDLKHLDSLYKTLGA